MKDIDRLKPYLTDYVNMVTHPAGRDFYVCPLCGSGEKRNRTAALKIYNNERYKCFACDSHGDIYSLIGQVEHKSFRDSVARAEELFGNYEPRPTTERKARKTNVKGLYKDYIEKCAADVAIAKDYLKKRGFSSADAKRFNLGYDKKTKGIVIPYGRDNSYYLWRSIYDKRFDKPKADVAGPEPIYNVCALKKDIPCFVCESPLDAISVMVASEYNAIAIGGTGTRKLLDHIDKNPINAPIIVSLDDDEGKERNAGLESAKVLMGELAGRRIPFVLAKYSKELYPKTRRKDANDMLCSRREIFQADLKENARIAILKKNLVDSEALW